MLKKFTVVFLVLLILGVSAGELFATHIRAGEIVGRKISEDGLTWEFTLNLYVDQATTIPNDVVDVNFGDGNIRQIRITSERVLAEYVTRERKYVMRHTYPGAGRYMLSFFERNRKTGVRNIQQSESQTFYIETEITIDAGLKNNNTPLLTHLPLDKASLGQRFAHNPAAYDPDGDSLAYRLITPRQELPDGRVTTVTGYRDPATFGGTREDGTGVSVFTLDSRTGDMVWDSPGQIGEFNVAFEIEEWRWIPNRNRYIQIGFVVRDMQIIVEDNPNKRPILQIPADTCIIAGSYLEKLIRATDPDRDSIRLSAFGAPFKLFSPDTARFVAPATDPGPNYRLRWQAEPASGKVSWQTDCKHIRSQPYDFVFKAEDKPPLASRRLFDLRTWRVKVVGPPPTGLVAVNKTSTIELTWDKYICAGASSIEIYRKEGPSNFVPGPCETGVPAHTGYRKIGQTGPDGTSFTDKGPFKKTATYCYIIYARFPDPAGGESIASVEVCAEIKLDVPLMTKASVLRTDMANGSIDVRWSQPVELDTELYKGPYQYRLYRAEGLNGTNFTLIHQASALADTAYTDTGLNTEEKAYNYRVIFKPDANGTLSDTTESASSVRLEASSGINSVNLAWQAEVPWSNSTGRSHYIYREVSQGQFELIDSIQPSGAAFSYVDKGTFKNQPLVAGQEYCYYVVTQGSYGDAKMQSPIINFSQIACAMPIDTIKPCPPVLSLDPLDCSDCNALSDLSKSPSGLTNTLSWVYPTKLGDKACKDPVLFRVYYAPYEDDELTLLATTTDTFFLHKELSSLAGCYQVTAVDQFGNESLPSNKECKDNCVFFELPNVISPNGDGVNEDFQPICIVNGFVKQVKFTVYNRWGGQVYYSDKNIMINWPAMQENKDSIAAGVYYYSAEVTFRRLKKQDERVVYKGWIQVLK